MTTINFSNATKSSPKSESHIYREGLSTSKIVSYVLLELQCSSEYRGYKYLKTAICMGLENPEYLHQVTKIIYPEIHRMYCKDNVTVYSIERNIRSLIKVVWDSHKNGTQDYHNSILYRIFDNLLEGKPVSNSKFIAMACDWIKLVYYDD